MTRAFKFLILLLATCLIACSHPRHDAIPAGATVLVLGDSLSYGTGAEKGEDYPSILATLSGWNVINAGVPGDTSADGLERLPGLLEETTPRLILVELGGNDFLRHVDRDETRRNLATIIGKIKAKKVPVVLLAVPTPNIFGAAVGNLSDAPLYEEVGKETDVPVISDILSEVLSKNANKSDTIHPNATGYRLIGERLTLTLRELGYLSHGAAQTQSQKSSM